MYALIRAGGKQYRVAPGETIRVERRPGKVGGKVTITGEEILAVRTDDKLVTGADAAQAKITAKIVEQGRHRKEVVMKYRKTKQYKITRGHRQGFTALEVGEIKL